MPKITRAQFIIIMLVTVIGLVAPFSTTFFYTPPKQTTTDGGNASPPSTEPPVFTPIREYSAVVEGNVSELDSQILFQASSPNSDTAFFQNAIRAIPGVRNASLSRSASGEGFAYSGAVQLNDSSFAEQVAFFMGQIPGLSIDSSAVPAIIQIPEAFNITDKAGAVSLLRVLPTFEVRAFVFPWTKPGAHVSFTLQIQKSSKTTRINAFERATGPYEPPIVTHSADANATIDAIDYRAIATATRYDEKVNSSEIKSALAAQGINATVQFSAPNDLLTVETADPEGFVSLLNKSGIEAFYFGRLYVPLGNKSIPDLKAAVKKAARDNKVNATVLEPTGALRVAFPADADPAAVRPKLPGKISEEYAVGNVTLPEEIGQFSLAGINKLPSQRLAVSARPGPAMLQLEIQTVFGFIIGVRVA
jgi:hypothetical protein